MRTRCAVNLGKEDFVRTEYRASLGGVMRKQGFALSKMKADSEKSAKFKIWGTQHERYVRWLVKKELLACEEKLACTPFSQNVFFVYHITSVLFFKSDKSETKVFYNKTLRSVHVGFIGDAFSKFKLLL